MPGFSFIHVLSLVGEYFPTKVARPVVRWCHVTAGRQREVRMGNLTLLTGRLKLADFRVPRPRPAVNFQHLNALNP